MRSELEILMDVSPLWTVDLKSFESGTPLDMPGEVCTLIPLNLFDFDSLFLFCSPLHSLPIAPLIFSLTGSVSFFSCALSAALVFTTSVWRGSSQRCERTQMHTHTHRRTVQVMCRLHQFFWSMYRLSFSLSGKRSSSFSMDYLSQPPFSCTEKYRDIYSTLNTRYIPADKIQIFVSHIQ